MKLLTLLLILASTTTYAQISGPTPLCIGNMGTYTDSHGYGTWTSSNPSHLSIDSLTGIATAHGSAPIKVYYHYKDTSAPTITGTSICQTISARNDTFSMVVSGAVPKIQVIGYADTAPVSVAAGSSLTMNETTAGYAWTVSDDVVGVIGTGALTVSFNAISAGVDIVTYTNSSGCTASRLITVTP